MLRNLEVNPVPACARNHKMYFTYVLLSTKDGKFYTGATHNLDRRFGEHNEGLNVSTAHRRPLSLVLFEACPSKTDALRREKYLKSGKGKIYLKKRLKYTMAVAPQRRERDAPYT